MLQDALLASQRELAQLRALLERSPTPSPTPPISVGGGFESQAGFKALLKTGLQPGVVGFGDGGTYEFRVVPSSASTLSRNELCGVELSLGGEVLAVTIERSSLPESLCTPTTGTDGRAFARRFVHRFTSARSATHTRVATPR